MKSRYGIVAKMYHEQQSLYVHNLLIEELNSPIIADIPYALSVSRYTFGRHLSIFCHLSPTKRFKRFLMVAVVWAVLLLLFTQKNKKKTHICYSRQSYFLSVIIPPPGAPISKINIKTTHVAKL